MSMQNLCLLLNVLQPRMQYTVEMRMVQSPIYEEHKDM